MLIIGISGGSGSGKTTLADRIVEDFAPHASVIRHDNYYRARDDLSFEERCAINYDEPSAFDNGLLAEHLEALRRGEGVDMPIYDYTLHNRKKESVRFEPTGVIIVEGILIFADGRVRDMLDIKIFVDTDADVRLARRIMRDVKERGRSLESVCGQYFSTVKPMHEKYVEPSKRFADIVVPSGGENKAALEMIEARIEREITV